MAIKDNGWSSVSPASPALRATSNSGGGQQQGGGGWLDQFNSLLERGLGKLDKLNELGTPQGLGGTYAMSMPTSVQGMQQPASYTVPQSTFSLGQLGDTWREKMNQLGTPQGLGNAQPIPGLGSVRQKYDTPASYPKPKSTQGGGNPNAGGSFVSGDGLRVNLGEEGTRYIGPDWAGNYLSTPDYINMYLDGRFSMLPPPEDNSGGFGSYYGGWGGRGWGGGGGGGYSNSDWEQVLNMGMGNWNIHK